MGRSSRGSERKLAVCDAAKQFSIIVWDDLGARGRVNIWDETELVPPELPYPPVALMRFALVGSVPRMTLTVMPGFKAAAVDLTPFT